MDNKVGIYMILMVAIVAVVGLVVVLSNGSASTTITGNVVSESGDSVHLNVFGKIFFVLFIGGIAVYLYMKNE